eukprot:g12498.t1
MNSVPPLILASQSPRRAQLLTEAGVVFEQRSPPFADPDQPPSHLEADEAEGYAQSLAMQKAQSLAVEMDEPCLILAADTICVDDAFALVGKPRDPSHAEQMIRSFINTSHRVISGVVLIRLVSGERAEEVESFADTATVTFGQVADEQLAAYLATDDWQGKAGGYNLFDRQAAGWPIEVSGDPTTVVGLPMRLNPSFDLSRGEARSALRAMAEDPVPAPRPVLVLGGYLDPGLLTESLGADLSEVLDVGPVITVSFSMTTDFDSCRSRVLAELASAYPEVLGADDASETLPIDVVGISMGGLVARYMAMDGHDTGKRLNIHRLFTISTPHQGATWAMLPSANAKQTKMRPGSAFLADLNSDANKPDYELYCYVRLRDSIVGPKRAALPGQTAWWVSAPIWQSPHLGAPGDSRIMADIARRLRREPAYATQPAAALP